MAANGSRHIWKGHVGKKHSQRVRQSGAAHLSRNASKKSTSLRNYPTLNCHQLLCLADGQYPRFEVALKSTIG